MYSNKKLATHFANGGTSGRSSRAFIKGNLFYSFGTHFIVAMRGAGIQAIVTTKKYSQTTTRHTTLVLQALENKGYIIKREEL